MILSFKSLIFQNIELKIKIQIFRTFTCRLAEDPKLISKLEFREFEAEITFLLRKEVTRVIMASIKFACPFFKLSWF